LTTKQWIRAVSIAHELRKQQDLPIITGGLHPTFAVISVLETVAFDYVCPGEGEEAVCKILTHLEKGTDIRAAGIPNIWVKGLGGLKSAHR
jgi:anaerobic magnesium-protoporphyrin IX monomethyl ester cyclase